MATYNKVCKACGKEFVATYHKTVYCCEKCRKFADSTRYAEKRAATLPKKTCVMCGKTYTGRNIKYCSLACAWKAKQVKSQRKNKPKLSANGTLCWHCKWATGKDGHCSWASHLVPVEGWEAKKTYLKAGEDTYTDSYIIKDCPLFEEG